MRIFGEARRPYQSSVQKKDDGPTLRRSEVVADIFNNRPSTEGTTTDVKLRLSHASRKISEGLRQRVFQYLNTQSELKQALDAIDLPGDLRGSDSQLAVRRMSTYLQWTRIREKSEEEELAEAEIPYTQVQALGKDEEMHALFQQRNTDREAIQETQKRHAPHYYYMAFPETYSFN